MDLRPPAPPFVARALRTAGGIFAAAGLTMTGIVRCPSALILRTPCPSCGTTRAARALLALDLVGAFRLHPVAPLVLVVLAALGGRAVWLVLRHGHARGIHEGRLGHALTSILVLSAFLELAVWLLRWFGLFGGPVSV